MAEQLVTVELGSIFRNFKQRIEKLRDDVTSEGGAILRREEVASIRSRWYDNGHTLRSLEEKIDTENDARVYRLFPTATSKRGAPYPFIGEYGTGQAGARTGGPAPAGYVYGSGAGMAARRYSRIAVQVAKPQIVANAKQLIANFTVS
jgi:hypothetical protein